MRTSPRRPRGKGTLSRSGSRSGSALSRIDDHLYDFDVAGDWLLLAGLHGLLHAWRADGSEAEMLPRARVTGEVVSSVEAVLGVARGFVVIGRTSKERAVVHYDFAGRVCTIHRVSLGSTRTRWAYDPALHTIVGHIAHAAAPSNPVFAVDLGSDRLASCYPPGSPDVLTSERAKHAFFRAFSEAGEETAPMPMIATDESIPEKGRTVILRPETGRLDVRDHRESWFTFTPRADGRPKLTGGRIIQARWSGDTLAILVGFPDVRRAFHLFSIADGRALGEYPLGHDVRDFALSRDGRRFARRIGDRHLEVRNVGGGSIPLFVTSKGKAHSRINVALGATFLTIQAGRHVHLVRWDRERMEFLKSEGDAGKMAAKVFGGEPWRVVRATATEGWILAPEWVQDLDRRRYQASCTAFGLTLVVDFLGQVAFLDRVGALVCMFFVFRDQIAAWMPDGTRIGPMSLIGGRPTPDGPERLGLALRVASQCRRVLAR